MKEKKGKKSKRHHNGSFKVPEITVGVRESTKDENTNFEDFLKDITNSRLVPVSTTSDKWRFINDQNEYRSGSRVAKSNSVVSKNKMGKLSWGWKDRQYQKSSKFGAPLGATMGISPCPKPLKLDNMLPPKINTETINSEEEEDRIEDMKREDDSSEVVGVVPLDGTDPYIYSREEGVPPFSFLDHNYPYSDKHPPPTYIDYKTLSKPKPTEKQNILTGLEQNEKGILQCVDREMLEKSKGVVMYVVKQIAKNIFSGLGVVAISLPVRIFEPRSALERVLDGFSFAPKYLTEACRK